MSGIAAPNVKDICHFIKYAKIVPLDQMTKTLVSPLYVYKNALFLYNGDEMSCLNTDFMNSIGKSHVLEQFKFIFS